MRIPARARHAVAGGGARARAARRAGPGRGVRVHRHRPLDRRRARAARGPAAAAAGLPRRVGDRDARGAPPRAQPARPAAAGAGAARDRPLVVAVDAALGPSTGVGTVHLRAGGPPPGQGVGKDLPQVGEIAVTATVNIQAGAMDVQILQSTRLFVVQELAEMIGVACWWGPDRARRRRRGRGRWPSRRVPSGGEPPGGRARRLRPAPRRPRRRAGRGRWRAGRTRRSSAISQITCAASPAESPARRSPCSARRAASRSMPRAGCASMRRDRAAHASGSRRAHRVEHAADVVVVGEHPHAAGDAAAQASRARRAAHRLEDLGIALAARAGVGERVEQPAAGAEAR